MSDSDKVATESDGCAKYYRCHRPHPGDRRYYASDPSGSGWKCAGCGHSVTAKHILVATGWRPHWPPPQKNVETPAKREELLKYEDRPPSPENVEAPVEAPAKRELARALEWADANRDHAQVQALANQVRTLSAQVRTLEAKLTAMSTLASLSIRNDN